MKVDQPLNQAAVRSLAALVYSKGRKHTRTFPEAQDVEVEFGLTQGFLQGYLRGLVMIKAVSESHKPDVALKTIAAAAVIAENEIGAFLLNPSVESTLGVEPGPALMEEISNRFKFGQPPEFYAGFVESIKESRKFFVIDQECQRSTALMIAICAYARKVRA